jgi:hypothetical protein
MKIKTTYSKLFNHARNCPKVPNNLIVSNISSQERDIEYTCTVVCF